MLPSDCTAHYTHQPPSPIIHSFSLIPSYPILSRGVAGGKGGGGAQLAFALPFPEILGTTLLSLLPLSHALLSPHFLNSTISLTSSTWSSPLLPLLYYSLPFYISEASHSTLYTPPVASLSLLLCSLVSFKEFCSEILRGDTCKTIAWNGVYSTSAKAFLYTLSLCTCVDWLSCTKGFTCIVNNNP